MTWLSGTGRYRLYVMSTITQLLMYSRRVWVFGGHFISPAPFVLSVFQYLIHVSICLQQDVRSGHGGAGGRNGPLANSYERAQVSAICIV